MHLDERLPAARAADHLEDREDLDAYEDPAAAALLIVVGYVLLSLLLLLVVGTRW